MSVKDQRFKISVSINVRYMNRIYRTMWRTIVGIHAIFGLLDHEDIHPIIKLHANCPLQRAYVFIFFIEHTIIIIIIIITVSSISTTTSNTFFRDGFFENMLILPPFSLLLKPLRMHFASSCHILSVRVSSLTHCWSYWVSWPWMVPAPALATAIGSVKLWWEIFSISLTGTRWDESIISLIDCTERITMGKRMLCNVRTLMKTMTMRTTMTCHKRKCSSFARSWQMVWIWRIKRTSMVLR